MKTLQGATLDEKTRNLSKRQERIYNFLRSNPVGVLSTVGPDGDPHGAVIYFTIDKRFMISFLTKSDTRKYDNLKHHSRIMLTSFDQATQTTAQIMGNTVEITDNYEINAVAGAILGASLDTSVAGTGLPPISKLQAGSYVALGINPVQIRMATYARPDPGDYTELFDTIESFELRSI